MLVSRSVGIKLQTDPFQKEPALPGQNVFRGSLLWGPRTEQAMSFIWDKGRGRLLLDLNRNRDLTDDPKGVFASTSRDDSQSFTNIHLVLPAATGDRAVRLQLQFNSYQAGSVNAYAGLCSYWQTKVSLRGTEWQFGLVESLLEAKSPAAPQYLLLRPWAERQRPFNLTSSSPDFCEFTTNLFFGNRAYALDCRYDARGDSAKYQVTFKEQAPRLGELKVTGAGLHRLILTTSRGMTALLDQPQGTVKLPVGSYSLEEIWLRQGETEVFRLNAGRVTVNEQRPANLVAGGPLTNSVDVKSQGDTLATQLPVAGGGRRRLSVSPGRTISIRRSSRCSRAPTGWRRANSNTAEAATAVLMASTLYQRDPGLRGFLCRPGRVGRAGRHTGSVHVGTPTAPAAADHRGGLGGRQDPSRDAGSPAALPVPAESFIEGLVDLAAGRDHRFGGNGSGLSC